MKIKLGAIFLTMLLAGQADILLASRKKKNIGPFICDLCGESCSTNGNLTRHKQQSCPFNNKKKIFTCECGASSSRKENLKRHQQQQCPYNKTKPIFICELCGTACSTKDVLKRHKKCSCPKNSKKQTFICKCGVKCSSLRALNTHKKHHCKKNKKKTTSTCDKCGKKYVRSSYLKKHKKTCKGNGIPTKPKKMKTKYSRKKLPVLPTLLHRTNYSPQLPHVPIPQQRQPLLNQIIPPNNPTVQHIVPPPPNNPNNVSFMHYLRKQQLRQQFTQQQLTPEQKKLFDQLDQKLSLDVR